MSSKRILIVDDAATVRLFHRTVLEGQGWIVEEAVNGMEALEKALGEHAFDLYLVDVNMPKLDGYGFLQQLRQLEVAQCPAVMVSTEAQSSDRLRALESGANFYLLKPIKPDALIACCARLLGLESAT
ncbi:MAG: response regulator [Proteobacteria bacterium]|nr:response regulator [Pseudomonadota bacterium]